MSRFEGLKNKEIAERLDISIKVVEKHISKALSSFRSHLRTDSVTILLLMWMIIMI